MTRTVKRLALIATGAALLGSIQPGHCQQIEGAAPFWRTPVSNPVYLESAYIQQELSLVALHQRLPNDVNTAVGRVPLDGDVNAFAVQLQLPLTERLAVVANKSGYIDFNPDSTLDKRGGYSDLAAGVKYGFLQSETLAGAFRLTYEFPSGSEEVLQQNGDGHVSPALILTRLEGDLSLTGVLGATLPIDNSEESTLGYAAVSLAKRFTDRLSGLVEVSWFRVLAEGGGEARFNGQGGNLLPMVAEFEGGDVINLGASSADDHPDFVSAALGGRYQLSDKVSIGLAYEMPLTPEEYSLMDDRLTANLSISF